ncbi:MAG: TlpA family protein disulfide reductase [Opitutaceae bacterium]|jgi:peroxiredoxin|nr:TlpA family protein disulfide reductase [Opitutaceae bacterium]
MKFKTLARIFAAAGLGAVLSLLAPLAPAQPAPPSAGAPAPAGVQKELGDLVRRVQGRLATFNAPPTEAQFADELGRFDAILAAHKGEKTDDAAQVLFMKAMLNSEVFNAPGKAVEALQRLKADFPGTKTAGTADEIIASLEERKAAQARKDALKPGVEFPDFAVKDTTGAALSVGKYKGRVVLVDFWATWCPPCLEELPRVLAAYQKYNGKGFEVIGISLDQDDATLAKFMEARKLPWPQHRDAKGELAEKYGAMLIPATFLIDREGRVAATDLRGPELEEQLEKLLGK